MIIDYNEKRKDFEVEGSIRFLSEIKKITGARKLKAQDEATLRYALPLHTTTVKQLHVDFGDELQWTGAAKTKRKWLLTQRKRRVDAKKGRGESYDQRLSPLQNNAMNMLLEGGMLEADDMGGGKTVITCVALELFGSTEVLIACPKSALDVWVTHLREWTTLTPYVLHGTPAQQAKALVAYEEEQGPKALITTHRMLPKYSYKAGWYNNAKTDDVGPLNQHWDVFIVDEAHEVGRDPANDGVRAMFAVGDSAKVCWPITGTPIENNPEDFWILMHLVDPLVLGARDKFRARYCMMDLPPHGGVVNMGLHPDMLAEFYWVINAYWIRRLKREINPELPKMSEPQHITIEMETGQAKVYRALAKDGLAVVDGELLMAPDQLSVSRLCGWAANGVPTVGEDGNVTAVAAPSNKAKYILDMAQQRNGDPFVVYANSPMVMKMIGDVLTKKKIVNRSIHGGTNRAQREATRKAFQAGSIPVLFINEAAASAITLTAADTIVFVQPSWKATTNQQARDRIDRWGQERRCHFIYLYSLDTVDEVRRAALQGKVSIQEQVLRDSKQLKAFLAGDYELEEVF